MNAAKDRPEVLNKVLQEHAALREKLGHIHSVLAEPEPEGEEIERLLREFLSMLIVHFSCEEEEGFFDEVVSRASYLADEAGKLRVEHKDLLHEVTALSQFASAGSPSMQWWRELNSRCHLLSKKLMQHEADESRLIQRAFQHEVEAGFCS
jgi:hypothetical protein